MCGIFAIWRKNGFHEDDPAKLARMGETLVHRGPDDYGYLLLNTHDGTYYSGQHWETHQGKANLLLGCRRLAILDTSDRGGQPMCNQDKNIFIIYNGEIFNYKEIRSQLEKKGYIFHSGTDTEVIINAYAEWGLEFVKMLDGMWAFIIWDQRQKCLVYSRDRFGIKPLYSYEENSTFYMASETKAIHKVCPLSREPDLKTIGGFIMTYNFDTGTYVLFKNIKPVPKAHLICRKLAKTETRKYWSYTDQSLNYDYSDPENQLLDLLQKSVSDYAKADRPVGLLLSGGLDSSSIAILDKQNIQPAFQHAFTAIFPEQGKIDEHRFAKIVADRCGLTLHCLDYEPGRFIDDIDRLIYCLDAPPAKGQELVRYNLLELVSQHVPVVLEGQGADECLAGYIDACLGPYLQDEIQRISLPEISGTLRRLISAAANLNNQKSWAHTLNATFPLVKKKINSMLGLYDFSKILSPDLQKLISRESPDYLGESVFSENLTNTLYIQHAYRVLPNLLNYGDRISMAHSVEARMPFLNHHIVEFLFGMPYNEKMNGKYSKYVLRKALKGLMPQEILDRTDKIGFQTPVRKWMQAHLKSHILPVMLSKESCERGIFHQQKLETLFRKTDRVNNATLNLIFRCFTLELWLRKITDSW